MKKILAALSLTITLFGCQKSGGNDRDDANAKYKVSLNIIDFAAKATTMGTQGNKANAAVTDTAKKYADNIYYRIYKADGTWLNETSQLASLATFGTITDSLPSGTYTVFLAASKGALTLSDKTVPYETAVYSPLDNNKAWNDTFTKSFKLTVAKADINQSVSLERVVSAYEVVLEDAIPTLADEMYIAVRPNFESLPMNGIIKSTPDATSHIKFKLTAADKGVKNKSFPGFLSNSLSPVTISLRVYSSANTVVADKSIDPIVFEKNKKTTLTGALMPGSPASNYKVEVDPTWGGNNNIKF